MGVAISKKVLWNTMVTLVFCVLFGLSCFADLRQADPLETGAVSLQWNTPVLSTSQLVRYHVIVKKGMEKTVNTVPAGVNSIRIAGLSAGTNYYIEITYDELTSDSSGERYTRENLYLDTLMDAYTLPVDITGLKIVSRYLSRVKIQWDAGFDISHMGHDSGYDYVCKDGSGNVQSSGTLRNYESYIHLDNISSTSSYTFGIRSFMNINGIRYETNWVSINLPPTETISDDQGGKAADTVTPTINKNKASLNPGKTIKLKVTGATGKVKWSSSNKSVATVSSTGKVKAKKSGSAIIKAKTGGKTFKCKITVKKKTSSKKTKTTKKQNARVHSYYDVLKLLQSWLDKRGGRKKDAVEQGPNSGYKTDPMGNGSLPSSYHNRYYILISTPQGDGAPEIAGAYVDKKTGKTNVIVYDKYLWGGLPTSFDLW